MKSYIFRISFLVFTLIAVLSNLSLFSSSVIYKNNFDSFGKVNLKHLFSTTKIKINYAGLTDEESLSGKCSIKFDFIINKNDSLKSTHYWLLPLRFVLKDAVKATGSFYYKGNSEDLDISVIPLNTNNLFLSHYNEKTNSNWQQSATYISTATLASKDEQFSNYEPFNNYEQNNFLLFKIDTKKNGRIVLYFDNLMLSREIMTANVITSLNNNNRSELEDHSTPSGNKNYSTYQSSSNDVIDQNNSADIYFLPPTKYNRLNGKNIPVDAVLITGFDDRGTPDQYLPFSMLIRAKRDLNNIKIACSDLKSSSGTISSENMDISIAKVWYQAGIRTNENKSKILTQELLVKDDDIIKIDYQNEKNLVRVNLPNNKKEYIDLTSADSKFPDNGLVTDSDKLLPFPIEKDFNKQIWFTLHIPGNATPGKYEGAISIFEKDEKLKSFPIKIEVLPFRLSNPILTYGIYYHGYVDDYTNKQMNFTNKTSYQYRIEMEDLKKHGVLYPTTYQVLKNIDKDLKIRKETGLPNDKLFTLGIQTGNSTDNDELEQLKKNINDWKTVISKYGYKELYVYGIDEARDDKLRSQRKSWTTVKNTGAKVFVAGYKETFTDMGDILDVAIVQGALDPLQAQLYHSKGNKIFSYSNPQAGEENPEIYRRNYGLALWKAGYDGAMDYAYQKNYGSTWNDWDHKKYRDENFTYPTANGIISTVQWEGFRAGVDDVRYLSTLLNLVTKAKKNGKDVSDTEKWLNNLNPNDDLDKLRNNIIDKILLLL